MKIDEQRLNKYFNVLFNNQRKLVKFSVLLLDTDVLPRLNYKTNDNLKPNKFNKCWRFMLFILKERKF